MSIRQICVVFISFFLSSVSAQRRIPSQLPKLVLVIMIEDLQTEQLFAFSNKLGEDGIRKLITQGAFYSDARYNHNSYNYGVNIATLHTGAVPSSHGVISDRWYNGITDEEEFIMASAVADTLSLCSCDASGLLVSTLGDELKFFYRNKSKVGSVGIRANETILAAGHAADDVYWLGDDMPHMHGSRYYTEALPEWVVKFNQLDFAQTYLKREWGPLNDLRNYHEYQYTYSLLEEPRSFLYDLSKEMKGKNSINLLKGSPFANVMMRDFAVSLIVNEDYGKDDVPDFLTVNFTCRPAISGSADMLSAEYEDMFLRLDKEITSLMGFVEEQVGMQNVLVVLSSSGIKGRVPNELSRYNVPNGVFSGRKAISLLSLYLMASYGQGKWVRGYNDGNVYLNHELLEKSNISISEVQNQTAAFLMQVAGVSIVLTSSQLQSTDYTHGAKKSMQNTFCANRSGDVMLSLKPGWVEEVEERGEKTLLCKRQTVPLVFYGWKMPRVEVSKTVDMVQVAPSISSFLKIAVPNGSEAPLLDELVH